MGELTVAQFLLALLGTSAVSGTIVKVVDYIIAKKQKKDEISSFDIEAMNNTLNTIKVGNQVLLRFRIKAECVEHIKRGWIDADNADILEQMHAAYKLLGGNGYLDGLMRRVRELPLKKEDDEHEGLLE